MTVDAPGTCHLVGCPRKGQHAPHVFIGAGEWADYNKAPEPEYCLGFPAAVADGIWLHVACSIDVKAWRVKISNLNPQIMATLVDDHRAGCPNRKAA